jgi:ribosomal protein S18 acetylase RimI-like enzyme
MYRIRLVQSEHDKEFVTEMNFQSYLGEIDPEGKKSRSEAWREFMEWEESDPINPYSDPHVVFLIEQDTDLAGLIWLALRDPFYVFNKPHVWMYNIHVSPKHRRKGVASMLLNHADAWTRQKGRDEIGLQVIDFNEPARKMYEKHGYEFVEQHNSSCFYRKKL